MDWTAVAGAQSDQLESLLARRQVEQSAVMQVANELQRRKEADRAFGLQESNARENAALRTSQQESLNEDRKARGEDRDADRAARTSAAFSKRLNILKKGDMVTPVERVQFQQEGVGGSTAAAGADDHSADPHFHFTGSQATEIAEQKAAATEEQNGIRNELAGQRNEIARVSADASAARAAATQAGSGGRGLSGYQMQNLTRALRTEYSKVTAPSREMQRQMAMMDAGLGEAKKGNMNAGTQAVIATFNKILDPTSVVRESEYARSPEGMALMQRIQGAIPKLTQGGIGMTPETLAQFGDLARTFTANAHATAQSQVAPILAQASDAGIEPTRITSDERQAAGASGAQQPTPGGAAGGPAPGSSSLPGSSATPAQDSAARAAEMIKKYGGG